MVPIFKLGRVDRDLGECVATVCPHCQTVSRLRLRQLKAVVVLFGIPLLDLDRAYQLFCSKCAFRKDLNIRELLPAMRAKRLFARLEAGEIASPQYLDALKALRFPSLHELLENAKSWRCAKCGEGVPANFNNCWQCGSGRPGSQSFLPISAFEPPSLPRPLTRPTNPWEGL